MRCLKFFLFAFLLSGCARLPVESSSLAQYLADEGARMHRLNVQLVNTMFKDKREKIDVFISEEFTPSVIDKLMKQVDAKDDARETIEGISRAVTKQAVSFRNQLQSDLETARVRLIAKLEEDYAQYREAATALKKLLDSSIRVDAERKQLFDALKQQSGGKLDMNAVETLLDSYLPQAGDAASKLPELLPKLEEYLKK